MKFYEIEKSQSSPISYQVELVQESVGRGKIPPKKIGKIITSFKKPDPYEARKEAIALADGWDITMLRYEDSYKVLVFSSYAKVRQKHFRNYDAYTINVYCLVEDQFGATKKTLILQYGNCKEWFVMDGLKWEFSQYQKLNLLIPKYTDSSYDNDGFDSDIIFTEPFVVELVDVDEPTNDVDNELEPQPVDQN